MHDSLTWVSPFDVVTNPHRFGRYLVVLVVEGENRKMVYSEATACGPTSRTMTSMIEPSVTEREGFVTSRE